MCKDMQMASSFTQQGNLQEEYRASATSSQFYNQTGYIQELKYLGLTLDANLNRNAQLHITTENQKWPSWPPKELYTYCAT